MISEYYTIRVDERGILGSWSFSSMPFLIKRFYWITLINSHPRGFHAHRNLQQILFVQDGQIELKLISKSSEKILLMRQGDFVHVEPLVWREIRCVSQNAVVGCLASEEYDEYDYIRNFQEFVELIR